MSHKPIILGIDTGGTMTDTILVDEKGEYVIGKAQTTPEYEAKGILNSIRDAASKWGLTLEEVVPSLQLVIYTGTIMLNRILTREGLYPIGIITTAGFEDVLRFGRGRQSWQHLPLPEHLHAVSHFHSEPLVERKYIRGARERILLSGHVMIPLYEEEVRKAAEELLSKGVKAIIIAFINSFANPVHELKAKEIVEEVMKERGINLPIFLSHRIHPILGETGRLNAVVIQVYAAEPSRVHLRRLREDLVNLGFKGSVRLLTNYGTNVSIDYEKLIHTVNSGPTGGIIGTNYLASIYGFDYALGTDVGGTSFDVGAVLAGKYQLKPWGIIHRYYVNLTMAAVESIGAGTGSYVRVNPITNRLEVLPQSAGWRIGVCWDEGGIANVTINDANLILGYLNPDYFLGGTIKLNRNRALEAFQEQVANKLRVDVYDAALAAYRMVNLKMKMHVLSYLYGLGFGPEIFYIVSYGGGGPLHIPGFVEGLDFRGILIPNLAAAFSAWGATMADFGIRSEISTELYVPPPSGMEPTSVGKELIDGIYKILPDEVRNAIEKIISAGTGFYDAMRGVLSMVVSDRLNELWLKLKSEIEEELKREKLELSPAVWRAAVRMLYAGMLDDIEVESKALEISPDSIWELVKAFEENFERIYARAAKSPEHGYFITRAILTAIIPTIKPLLKADGLGEKEPPKRAYKGEREIYWNWKWYKAGVWEMDLLKPGNILEGPCIIEHPATTFVVPPDYKTFFDPRRIFWLMPAAKEIPKEAMRVR